MRYSVVNWKNRTYYLFFDDKGLHAIDLSKIIPADYQENSVYQTQLLEYFKGERQKFDCPIYFNGTSFQKKVWQTLLTIPFGQTQTYSHIATAIHQPTATRAVGGAIGKNPILIIVPCHRVIGKTGKLTGFSSGLDLKRELLDLENITYIE